MFLVDRNDEVQALAASTADPAFAYRIRLGRLAWSLQHGPPQRSQSRVQISGIDTIPIMDDESISFVAGDAFSKLLQRPIGSRMSGDIEMTNTPSCDFNNDKD